MQKIISNKTKISQTENPDNEPSKRKRPNWDKFMMVVCIVLVINTILTALDVAKNKTYIQYNYTEYIDEITAQNIETANIGENIITGMTKTGENYVVNRIQDDNLTDRLLKAGVIMEKDTSTDAMSTVSALVNIGLTVLMFYYIFHMLRNGPMGKMKAKKFEKEKSSVGFANVAGQDEAKESMAEIIDFLKNTDKYTAAGAKLPKGALLVGPPGTGKTLLAKAVAGESGVPFFSISGSDFVEMFVGTGASRVRSLFAEAKKAAPCIIFIDEIDAIAGARESVGNSEREQTLNQLLTEMDGFGTESGIVVLGATNRPECLDPAILRPGRFDRRITVELPDLRGREAILKVHAEGLSFDDDVDLQELAIQTAGVSGADLAGIMNEAAIAAVRNGRIRIMQKDLTSSIEAVLVGKEKKTRLLSPKEKKIVAGHEIGHALVAVYLTDSEPVQKISIVPRTKGALGFVMKAPAEETYLKTKEELLNEIAVLLAGRAAEELLYGKTTTGASNDLEKATQIATDMVTKYGFGNTLSNTTRQQNVYLKAETIYLCSEQTKYDTDLQIAEILRQCYEKAKQTLSEHRDIHLKLTEYLTEKESITGKEFAEIMQNVA